MDYLPKPDTLKLARLMHGLTQAEAAKTLGCGLRNYVNWEHGQSTPRNFWSDRLRDFCSGVDALKTKKKQRQVSA